MTAIPSFNAAQKSAPSNNASEAAGAAFAASANASQSMAPLMVTPAQQEKFSAFLDGKLALGGEVSAAGANSNHVSLTLGAGSHLAPSMTNTAAGVALALFSAHALGMINRR